MKLINLYTYIFLFLFISLNGQDIKTIYANQNNKVLLVFPTPIKKGIVGSNNFLFSYNIKKPEEIGTLNAKKGGKPSNLFVTTINGSMYSFEVRYKENLSKSEFVINIDNKEALNYKKQQKINIKNAKTIRVNESKSISTDNYDFQYSEKNTTENHYEQLSKEILNKNKYILKNHYAYEEKVFLKLKGYFYNEEQLYFHFEIENTSKIDYDVNYLTFYISSKNKKKRTLNQRVFLGNNGKPKYTNNLPKRVQAGQKVNFVAVFDKFTINQKKALIITLDELKGDRVLELKLLSKIINNPKNDRI